MSIAELFRAMTAAGAPPLAIAIAIDEIERVRAEAADALKAEQAKAVEVRARRAAVRRRDRTVKSLLSGALA